jgi:hypothetical protein
MISTETKEKVKKMQFIYRPIGIIYSEHTEQENTPIQGIFNPSLGRVEVFS